MSLGNVDTHPLFLGGSVSNGVVRQYMYIKDASLSISFSDTILLDNYTNRGTPPQPIQIEYGRLNYTSFSKPTTVSIQSFADMITITIPNKWYSAWEINTDEINAWNLAVKNVGSFNISKSVLRSHPSVLNSNDNYKFKVILAPKN